MVACVRICCRFSLFLICSKSFPSSFAAIKYSNSAGIKESSSGKRFWYLFFVNLCMTATKMGALSKRKREIYGYWSVSKWFAKYFRKLTDFIINLHRNTIHFNNELIFWVGFNVADNFIGFTRFQHVFINLLQNSLQTVRIVQFTQWSNWWYLIPLKLTKRKIRENKQKPLR